MNKISIIFLFNKLYILYKLKFYLIIFNGNFAFLYLNKSQKIHKIFFKNLFKFLLIFKPKINILNFKTVK